MVFSPVFTCNQNHQSFWLKSTISWIIQGEQKFHWSTYSLVGVHWVQQVSIISTNKVSPKNSYIKFESSALIAKFPHCLMSLWIRGGKCADWSPLARTERRQIFRDVNISFNLFRHLPQTSQYLDNNSEQNQNLCSIINKNTKLLCSQNHGKLIDCVRTFCEHSGGLCNLMSTASLNANNFELRLRNRLEWWNWVNSVISC